MKYFRESIEKFKKDALSKVIYDVVKYLLSGILLVQVLKYTPKIKEILLSKVEISIWLLISGILASILISFLLYYLKFRSVSTKLREQSQIDKLTGLKNNEALDEDLDRIFKESYQGEITFILIDVDNFKKFNDDHGHELADSILIKVGELLHRDCRYTDETYRYFFRGDEFMIVAKDTNISNGKLAADRKRQLISEANFEIENKIFKLTVCCGVTQFQNGDTKETLKQRIGNALLQAKKNPNKNKVEIIV